MLDESGNVGAGVGDGEVLADGVVRELAVMIDDPYKAPPLGWSAWLPASCSAERPRPFLPKDKPPSRNSYSIPQAKLTRFR